jgi:hypothetical protein
MSFFHKSVNEKLLEHISQLDEFGLLPVDWAWHKEKVQSLTTISEKLLDDLIRLHNSHQDLGDTIPHIIPLIKELHANLEMILKEHKITSDKQKEESILINRLLEHLRNSLERQGYVRYGTFRGPIMYLTPKEIAYYNSLVDENKWKKALRYIKNKWNERVDRSFIQSIHTIHWGHLNNIEYGATKLSRGSELGCNAYLSPPYKCNWIGGLGLMINGRVTLAGNTDIQTNQWRFGKNEFIQRYTEYAEHLCLNKMTFIPPNSNGRHNEFLVDNWKPIALVFDEDKLDPEDYVTQLGRIPNKYEMIVFLKEFAAKLGLPLLDNAGRKV